MASTPKNNPPSQRYPFESDIATAPSGAQRALRNAFNAILDLQQANRVHSTNIATLQKTSGSSAPVTVPVSDPPLHLDPEVGILPVPTAGRGGTSPTGSSSPNSGATGATNSSYAQGAYIAGVTPQTTVGSVYYAVQDSDYNGVIVFNTASAISIGLNSAVGVNFACSVFNIGLGGIVVSPMIIAIAAGGAGYLVGDVLTITQGGAAGGTLLVTTVNAGVVTAAQVVTGGTGYRVATGLATTGGTGAGATITILQVGQVNGSTSVSFQSGAFTILAFDGVNWWAMAYTGILPHTFAPVAHQFLTGYNAATGTFTGAQPDFTDLTGTIATAQGPAGSFSGSVALAKLTGGGANGSLTVVNGWIMAVTQPT